MLNVTILVVDNVPDTLRTVCEFLERAGYTTIRAATKEEGKRLIEQGTAQLAIIDMRLINEDDDHDFSGIELAKEVRANIPRIIYSQYPSYEAARDALGMRVDGLPAAVDFVAKYAERQTLLTAVRKALLVGERFYEGESTPGDAQSERLGNDIFGLDLKARQLIVRGTEVELTPIEFAVIELFLRNEDKTLSHEDIVEAVFNEQFNEYSDRNRVNNIIHRIREKIARDGDRFEFLHTVRGHGFKLLI